jgi:dTDP-4-amino-4,6-dideoxygalactose transaminase
MFIADYISGGKNGTAASSTSTEEKKAANSDHAAGSPVVLLTASCTGALEMAALLSEVGPGDEVILPSYTFVSTVNAFVLRGATPVFVDVRISDVNIDPKEIANAVTSKTRVICVVHYAGISCDMDAICAIAKKHNILVSLISAVSRRINEPELLS